jgi:hypothetical protein
MMARAWASLRARFDIRFFSGRFMDFRSVPENFQENAHDPRAKFPEVKDKPDEGGNNGKPYQLAKPGINICKYCCHD